MRLIAATRSTSKARRGTARYDPAFLASNGNEERRLPVRWNTLSGTGGIGWDFPIATNLVLRPIFNFSRGHVESDASLAGRPIGSRIGKEIEFLENGRMNAYGLCSSIMLDYERYRPANEIDVELRYTNIFLRTFGSTPEAVAGGVSAQSASLWARYRAPTGPQGARPAAPLRARGRAQPVPRRPARLARIQLAIVGRRGPRARFQQAPGVQHAHAARDPRPVRRRRARLVAQPAVSF